MAEKTIDGFFPATAMPDPDWRQVLWPAPDEVLAELGAEQPGMDAVDLCSAMGSSRRRLHVMPGAWQRSISIRTC